MERERGWERERTRGEEGEWEEKGHSGRGKKSGKVGRKESERWYGDGCKKEHGR
jgi:hypothetical protein